MKNGLPGFPISRRYIFLHGYPNPGNPGRMSTTMPCIWSLYINMQVQIKGKIMAFNESDDKNLP
jgi:hypothetical protein